MHGVSFFFCGVPAPCQTSLSAAKGQFLSILGGVLQAPPLNRVRVVELLGFFRTQKSAEKFKIERSKSVNPTQRVVSKCETHTSAAASGDSSGGAVSLQT